ncbi:Uncharacterised protein [uncultured archaeon]|nr:Uncharacterised protein [uncultured archaeon]
MKKSTFKGSGSIQSDGIYFKEGNCVTKIYKVQGLDLVIQQKKPSGKTVYLQHYSNPGTMTFIGIMKFLFVNKIPIPAVPKVDKNEYDAFKGGAHMMAEEFAKKKFPISYPYFHGMADGTPTATLTPKYENGKPYLEVNVGKGQNIIITPTIARELVKNIPRLYPDKPTFRIAQEIFSKHAKKHPEQIIHGKPKYWKQLEFRFAKRVERTQEKLKKGKMKRK